MKKSSSTPLIEFKPNAEYDRYYWDLPPNDDGRSVTVFHTGNRIMDEHAAKVRARSQASELRRTRIAAEGIPITLTKDPHIARIAEELQFTEQPGKDMIKEMKERMRRDNVSTFFALPLFAPQTTTTQDALFYDELKHGLCQSTARSDKKYFMKRNGFTDYNEDRIKYKDQMRDGL
jgi:hypothetical protein